MSQSQYKPNHESTHAGEIAVRETQRGFQFFAFNEQRKKTLHIGTMIGQTYEKVAPVLQFPEASFALTQAEYVAILETGAQFIRIVTPGKSATYAISVQDFGKFSQPYHNAFYGDQLRTSLDHFAYSGRTAKRNTHTDNPKLPKPGPIAPRERSKQFDFTRLLDR